MNPRNADRKSPSNETAPSRTPLQRLTEWLAAQRASRPAAAVRAPRRPRLVAPRPSWLSSFASARVAVRAGIGAEEFLRHRLSRRLAALPIPPEQLPVELSVERGGAIVARPAERRARAPWLDAFLRAHGSATIGPEIQMTQADLARLAARIDVQRRRVDELEAELRDAARVGEAADPGDEAQAQQMGRPPVPPPLGLALQAFALVLLVAETWQLAIPSLEASGVHAEDLVQAAHANPAGLALGGLFALGASLSLFLLAHLGLRRGTELLAEAPRRRTIGLALGAVAGGVALALAWCLATARAGDARSPRCAQIALFLVALAIPVTAAWLARLGRQLDAVRAAAAAEARAWDLTHFRAFADLSRRAGFLAEEEKRLARLEAERAAAQRRLRALQQRTATAERLAADARDAEDNELALVVHAIGAGLELDRYEYVRQAGLRGLPVDAKPTPVPVPVPAHGSGDVGRNLGLAG